MLHCGYRSLVYVNADGTEHWYMFMLWVQSTGTCLCCGYRALVYANAVGTDHWYMLMLLVPITGICYTVGTEHCTRFRTTHKSKMFIYNWSDLLL